MTRTEQMAAAALVIALAWTMWDVSRIEARTAPAPTPKPTAQRKPPAALAEDAYANIVTRSLFVPSRRADFASVRNNPNAVGGHILRGVLFGAAGDVALFEPLSGGPSRRLHVDSMIGGYRIIAIEEAGVVLDRDGAQRHLPIDDSDPPIELTRAQDGYQAPTGNPEFPQQAFGAPTPDEIEQ